MKRLFFGGIHPLYKKEISVNGERPTAIIPNQVVIPLQQHIGTPCKPLVCVGDRVLKGQKIGDGDGMCVPVHSSVSGTVVAVEPRPHPNGQMTEAVVIDNDFKEEAVAFEGCSLPTEELDTDTVLHTVREAGIVGMGGAAFPGDIKALSALGSVEVLFANACECEPYITADDCLLRNDPEQVLEGIKLLRHILKPNRTVLAIEDNKKEAVKKLKELLNGCPDIETVILPTRYPQGSEKQLIQAVTGRQVPPGGLPIDVGCVVFNVSTFAAIYKAVRLGMPLTERIVTVSGEAVSKPQNFLVKIGTPFSVLLENAGGLKDGTDRVLNGGPMMGTAQGDLSVPVVKATNAILGLFKDKNDGSDNPVCIRCGKCVEVCPMHLKPLFIARNTIAGNVQELKRLNVTDCVECGCCAYTCPAKLPLTEKCRMGKRLVKEAGEK